MLAATAPFMLVRNADLLGPRGLYWAQSISAPSSDNTGPYYQLVIVILFAEHFVQDHFQVDSPYEDYPFTE